MWEQSLGVITSSAEQEDDSSSQESRANSTALYPGQRGCLEKHKVTEERPPLHSFYSTPSFAKYQESSFTKCVGNSPNLTTCFSPSQFGHKRYSLAANEFSSRTFSANSVAWEDLPFSESLTEFLCKENKETADNNLEISNTTVSRSQLLLDITNTPPPTGGDSHDLSNQVCKNHVESLNRTPSRIICSNECNQDDDEASSLSFDKEDEEQPEGDTYNCSADLFSRSLVNSTSTEMLSTHAETARMTKEACSLFCTQDKKQLRTENATVTYSTPNTQKLKSSERNKRDSLVLRDTQDFDFVPPSQSTPIVKVGVVPPESSTTRNLTSEFCSQTDTVTVDSKRPSTTTSVNYEVNVVRTTRLSQVGRESTKENLAWNTKPSRRSCRLTPKRRFWKPGNHKNQAQQQQSIQRMVLHLRSTGTIQTKRDSNVCNVTTCDFEDSEVAVPPSPLAGVTLRRRRRTGNSKDYLGSPWSGLQGDGVYCKRTLLDETPSSLRRLAQLGKCDNETADASSVDGSKDFLLDEENQTCDWSRDLFSDSV